MWGKLKSIFVFNGFDADIMRSIRKELVEVTYDALSKLSLGLAILYAAALLFERSPAYLQTDLLYLTAVAIFQCCLYEYRKTNNIHIAELAIMLFIPAMLGIALYSSTALSPNNTGVLFPIYLLLFAVMFTGNPIAIDTLMLLMSVGFFFCSYKFKSPELFREDFFTTGFVLLIANMVNAMVSRSRISTIIKTVEAEESRKKYAAMAENYQTLYNNVPCGIMEIINKDGRQRITHINSQGMQLYGYPKEEDESALAIDLTESIHAEDRELLMDSFSKLSEVGDKVGYEYRLKRRDGSYIWVIGQTIVTARNGAEQALLAAFVDIDAEKKAIDANEAKSKFLSRMSHDIRTPMNAIIGLTDIVLDTKDLPEEARTNLKSVRVSSMFLLGLINDILDVSKIEANEMELHREPYYIGEFLDYLNTMIRPLCDKEGLSFTVTDNHEEYRYILTDKVRFNQIFFNLLSNAVKFTPSGGRVEVSVRHGEVVGHTMKEVIIISDTGIGMSEQFQKKMFVPFSQESGEHIDESQGSGLGLAIVKQIVDLMGGTIAVESKVGEGTTFAIGLDLEICNPVQKQEVAVDLSVLQGKRILLCEDHPINRQIAERLLRKAGMTVESAENGAEGVDKFRAAPAGYYDAILTDIRMPVMDGLEAAGQIRASDHRDAKTIPIIAMTANAFDTDRELSLAAGMDDHIIKPVDPDTLYKTLARLLPGGTLPGVAG